MKDPYRLFHDGTQNTRLRVMRIADVTELNDQKIKTYVKEAMQNAKKGIVPTPPVRRTTSMVLPKEVHMRLERLRLSNAFKERPPYQKRDYRQWIISAQKEDTRERRVTTLIRDLQVGTYMKIKYL